jgi:uncharacterized protein (DUF1015 family)
MAEIQPLKALHYDRRLAGPLDALVAPPYDVIDAAERAELVARSPFNVVQIDLPTSETGGDPYAAAEETFESWRLAGAIVQDREAAIWPHEQTYTGPDGVRRTRLGIFCRVRVEDYGPGRIRPHERTHPGPREDRLRLTRATRANLSPIFVLYSDPGRRAGRVIASAIREPAWGEVADDDGTVHRIWRVTSREAIAAVEQATVAAELLIADGHHRYETARVYAEEVGGEGPHRYVLTCLVALEDPGLTVFPTHRLVRGLDEARWAALDATIERDFDVRPVELDALAPEAAGADAPLEVGYLDRRGGPPRRLTLRDQATADAALSDRSEAYRHLDTGVLETLILTGALGLDEQAISHLQGLGYARDARQAIAAVTSGEYDAAFLLRPTPVEQVRAVAESGESMPPKSTYFFPKLLTGLLFNPLE